MNTNKTWILSADGLVYVHESEDMRIIFNDGPEIYTLWAQGHPRSTHYNLEAAKRAGRRYIARLRQYDWSSR